MVEEEKFEDYEDEFDEPDETLLPPLPKKQQKPERRPETRYEEEEEDEEPKRKPGRPTGRDTTGKFLPKEQERQERRTQPTEPAKATPPQYVAVPRVVPIETMLNELYDGQQEIKQTLLAIMEKLG